jgi:competence protein ComEA
MITGFLYVFRFYAPIEYPFWKRSHPNADLRSGETIVELDGGAGRRGIYFLPPKTTVRDMLDTAGVANRSAIKATDQERPLRSGMFVGLDERRPDNPALQFGRMANATRFVLDMPLALNRATLQDLMRVPGIGERTAEAIIETRQGLGGFRHLEDLLEVRGIGPKKLTAFKRYFYIDAGH